MSHQAFQWKNLFWETHRVILKFSVLLNFRRKRKFNAKITEGNFMTYSSFIVFRTYMDPKWMKRLDFTRCKFSRQVRWKHDKSRKKTPRSHWGHSLQWFKLNEERYEEFPKTRQITLKGMDKNQDHDRNINVTENESSTSNKNRTSNDKIEKKLALAQMTSQNKN